ncbi:pentatricopeptide repeat-containing protein [Tanacetum coccineum]
MLLFFFLQTNAYTLIPLFRSGKQKGPMDLPDDVTFKIHYDGVFLLGTPLTYINDMGLKLIQSNKDVDSLYDFAKTHGTVEVFIAHLLQNLAEYYFKNSEIDGSNELPPLKPRPLRKYLKGKVLFTDTYKQYEEGFEHCPFEKEDEQVNMLEILAEMVDKIGAYIGVVDKNVSETCAVDNVGDTCTVDNGKGKRKKIKARSRGNGIVIRDNDDPSYGNDSNNDSKTNHEKGMFRFDESDSEESLKSLDYLSEVEDEVIQLRERIDIVKKHQDMDALMRRIKAKGCDLKDHFHLVDKSEWYPIYDEATHWKLKKPKFVTVEQFKECLTYYAMANGFNMWYDRYPTYKVIANCGQRKEVIKDPSKGKQRAYKKFPSKDPSQPFSHSICPWRCYAKKLKVDGSFQDHYGLLWLYAKARIDSNVGSTVKVGVTINPDEKTYFDRFYVCLNGLKEGWKFGCKNIIALDECFLKKPYSGEILTLVGRYGNNQIYPMACAILNVENKENWSWFLSLLGEDLDFPNGSGLTFISDQHNAKPSDPLGFMKFMEYRIKIKSLAKPWCVWREGEGAWQVGGGWHDTLLDMDVKKNLKHHKDNISLKDLGKHLLVEEQYLLENKALTRLRPDIAYVVQRLSRHTSSPGKEHWNAVNRVFKCLKKTMVYGLEYNEDPSVLEDYTNQIG